MIVKTYVHIDEQGAYRVGGKRVSLDSVVYGYLQGFSADSTSIIPTRNSMSPPRFLTRPSPIPSLGDWLPYEKEFDHHTVARELS
jgi:hypothetical protein